LLSLHEAEEDAISWLKMTATKALAKWNEFSYRYIPVRMMNSVHEISVDFYLRKIYLELLILDHSFLMYFCWHWPVCDLSSRSLSLIQFNFCSRWPFFGFVFCRFNTRAVIDEIFACKCLFFSVEKWNFNRVFLKSDEQRCFQVLKKVQLLLEVYYAMSMSEILLEKSSTTVLLIST